MTDLRRAPGDSRLHSTGDGRRRRRVRCRDGEPDRYGGRARRGGALRRARHRQHDHPGGLMALDPITLLLIVLMLVVVVVVVVARR